MVRVLDFRVEGLGFDPFWVIDITTLNKVLCTYVSLFTKKYKQVLTLVLEVNQ